LVQNGAAQATIAACREQLRIRRRVELLETDYQTVPALAKLFRPRVIVSERTLETLSPDQLTWLFRHELAHIRPGDVAIQYLWWWARAIQWFNPLVWWASSRARNDADLACDQSTVARASGSERVVYGNTLLAVAEMMLESSRVPGSVALLTREPELMKRISIIAGYMGPSRLWALISATFMICLACSGLTDAVPGSWSSARAARPSKQTAKSPAAGPMAKDQKSQGRTLRIHVLGPDGKPLPGAKIFANIVTTDRKIVNQDYFSDVDGWATVELPEARTDILKFWASKVGYVKWFASWWPKQ
jgi:bla regulator protein blaR1